MKRRRSNAGLFQRLTELGSRTTYHGKIRTRGGRRSGAVRQGKQSVYRGVRIVPVGDGEFETSLDSSRFDSLRDAKRFVDAWKKQGNSARRRNVFLGTGSPTGFSKQRGDWYVHGIHGAKSPELAGAYGTKAEAQRAAKRLAAEENETVSVSGPRGAGFQMTPKKQGNLPRSRGVWPAPYEIDRAVNKRAQAMARTRRQFTREQSDRAADAIVRSLYGRNALVPDSDVSHVRSLLWNDYNSYAPGYKGAHRNPRGAKGRFERCVKAVSERGGAYDPRAVCGAQEKKYRKNPQYQTVSEAKKDFYRMGKESGKKERGQEYPVLGPDRVTGQAEHMAKILVDHHGIPASKAGSIAHEFTRGYFDAYHSRRGKRNPEDQPNRRAFVGAQRKDGRYPVQLIYPLSGKRLNKLMTQDQIDRLRAEGYDVFSSNRNPADSAVEAYKIFHGREPEELVTIAKQRHYHKHLAAAGELEKLVIENDRYRVTLQKFKGSLLCFNEQALPELARKGKVKLTQLFIEDGDQSVNLEDFGIDPDNIHEIETLGKAVKIDYFTTKDHLGSEGGTAVYGHKFRSTNQGGRHVTVKIAKYPDVIYRVRDNQLEFSGGSYEIRAEGIDK